MKVVLELQGEAAVQRRFLRSVMAAKDLSPAWAAVYDYLLDVEVKQFETEGRQSGHAWPALAENTLRKKARAGLNPAILHATEALRISLTQKGAANQQLEITPNAMRFGSTLPYASMHQRPGGSAQYPQRKPIDLTEENRRVIMKMTQMWILRGITSAIS